MRALNVRIRNIRIRRARQSMPVEFACRRSFNQSTEFPSKGQNANRLYIGTRWCGERAPLNRTSKWELGSLLYSRLTALVL